MSKKSRAIVDILNRGIRIEYESIWYYPRLAQLIADKESAELFLRLGQDSVKHSDQTAKLIRSLGGDPIPNLLGSMQEAPQQSNIITVLRDMLEKERIAAQLYREAAGLTDKADLKTLLLGQVEEEERHAKTVEDILARIT